MKPNERYIVTAYCMDIKIPLVFVAFNKEILELEIIALKKMGFDSPEIKTEKIA